MVRSHALTAVFLALVSANVIQASLLSGGLFSSLPSLANLAFPRTYFDDFRLGLGQHLNIPPRFRLLNHFVTAPHVFPLFNGAAGGASAASAASSAGESGLSGTIPALGGFGGIGGGSRLARSANAASALTSNAASEGSASNVDGVAPMITAPVLTLRGLGEDLGGSRPGRSPSAASALTSDAASKGSASNVDGVAPIINAPVLTLKNLEGLEDLGGLGGSRLERSASDASALTSDAAFEGSAPSVDGVAPMISALALTLADLGNGRLERNAVERAVRSYTKKNYDESAASVAATNAAATQPKQTVTSY
ncbi:glycine-rich protein 1-like [Pseudomyrmex gracilis]|uniref:glycine-rich protein 1-like n=1 Tax=Pseudomyrmex gracilis TaxID=219809 RepID=UPI000994BB1F|nr:glycine-rich protein 1-like [Pseudomyrmex gracilis]